MLIDHVLSIRPSIHSQETIHKIDSLEQQLSSLFDVDDFPSLDDPHAVSGMASSPITTTAAAATASNGGEEQQGTSITNHTLPIKTEAAAAGASGPLAMSPRFVGVPLASPSTLPTPQPGAYELASMNAHRPNILCTSAALEGGPLVKQSAHSQMMVPPPPLRQQHPPEAPAPRTAL